jgi:hypothetical protein
MTNDERRMTNTEPSRDAKGRKSTAPARRRRPGCRDCPFRAPSGQCLDQTIRSGRCGDRVWYPLPGNRQGHRLWVKPRDPRTPKQRYWRTRLAAASRSYSASLTDEQQDTCMAVCAKVGCRPRLGPSGVLTGQQYWVGQECAKKTEPVAPSAEQLTEGLQTKGISLPTWETRQGVSRVAPGQHCRNTGRVRTGNAKTPWARRCQLAPNSTFPPLPGGGASSRAVTFPGLLRVRARVDARPPCVDAQTAATQPGPRPNGGSKEQSFHWSESRPGRSPPHDFRVNAQDCLPFGGKRGA